MYWDVRSRDLKIVNGPAGPIGWPGCAVCHVLDSLVPNLHSPSRSFPCSFPCDSAWRLCTQRLARRLAGQRGSSVNDGDAVLAALLRGGGDKAEGAAVAEGAERLCLVMEYADGGDLAGRIAGAKRERPAGGGGAD